jgi:chaperonin GroEL
VTDQKRGICEFEDPKIFITDFKLSSVQDILALLELTIKERFKLVIIAENVEGDALTTLILNKMRGLPIVAVKAPGFGENKRSLLQDIAVLTGAEMISQDLGLKLDKIDIAQLGSCKKIEVSADSTIILDGGGSKQAIKERCEAVRDAIEHTKSDYDKDKLKERLGKLSGGVAVLKVGGASEVEVNEKKDRITDALNATRAAVEEGIVAGGGSALLFASRSLDDVVLENDDQRKGLQILKNALRLPAQKIADNAGERGQLIVGKILESNDQNFGFDAQNCKFVNMLQAGIIDPAKVVRTALVDAASVAGLMTTTEAMVVELTKTDDPRPPSPGMGGMNY